MEIPKINLEITIGENETAKLIIDQDEDIEKKLDEFCLKYKLGEAVRSMLMDQIVQSIKKENESITEEENEDENEENDQNEEEQNIRLNQTNTNKSENSFILRNKSAEPLKKSFIDGKMSLYDRFKYKLEDKKQHLKHILEMRLEEEMKEATFHPKISENSIRLTENSNNSKVEERLINYGREKREKFSREQTKKALEDNNFPFQPKISGKSYILGSIASKKRDEYIEKLTKNDLKNEYKTEANNQKETYLRTNSSKEEYDTVSFNESAFKNNKSNLNTSSKYTFSNMKAPTILNTRNSLKTDEKDNNLTNFDISIRTDRSHSNVNKEKKMKSTNPNNNIHEVLYKEALVKRDKKNKMNQQWMERNCPFRPQIAESVKILNRDENQEEFLNRLMTSKMQTEEMLVSLRKQQEERNSYKPSLKRNSTAITRERNDNLDGYYDQKLMEKKNKVQSEELQNNLEKKKHWLENSMKIVLKMKIEKYKEIFDLLDGDKDGYISSKYIKLSSLNSEMLEALTPLLDEIQSKNKKMNFKEFCINADKLLHIKIFSSKK